MARTPMGLTARTEHVSARLRPSTRATLDKLRGNSTITHFLEKLILEEAARQEKK